MEQEPKDTTSDLATPINSIFPEDAQPVPQQTDNDFHPIKISGEPLSATIIRERRERPW
jgi:hypothetical protein